MVDRGVYMSKGLDSTRSIWHAQNFCSYLSIEDNGDYLDMHEDDANAYCSNSFVLLVRFHALVFFESCHCHLACEYSRFSLLLAVRDVHGGEEQEETAVFAG